MHSFACKITYLLDSLRNEFFEGGKSSLSSGHKFDAVNQTDNEHKSAPPNVCVQTKKNNGACRGVENFPDSGAKNQDAIHQQRNSDKEPDRNSAFLHIRLHPFATRKQCLPRPSKPRPRWPKTQDDDRWALPPRVEWRSRRRPIRGARRG